MRSVVQKGQEIQMCGHGRGGGTHNDLTPWLWLQQSIGSVRPYCCHHLHILRFLPFGKVDWTHHFPTWKSIARAAIDWHATTEHLHTHTRTHSLDLLMHGITLGWVCRDGWLDIEFLKREQKSKNHNIHMCLKIDRSRQKKRVGGGQKEGNLFGKMILMEGRVRYRLEHLK